MGVERERGRERERFLITSFNLAEEEEEGEEEFIENRTRARRYCNERRCMNFSTAISSSYRFSATLSAAADCQYY